MNKRLVLILRYFTVGGLERVVLSHVRLFKEQGYDVTVCVLEPGRDNALVSELDPAIRLVVLPRRRISRIRALRQVVDGAVVLIHFGDGRLYPSLRPGLTTARTVVRFCHSDYSHLRFALKNRLDRVLARQEDLVVAVGGRSTHFLTEDVHVPAEKVTTLVNAVDTSVPPSRCPAPWPWAEEPYLVAVQSLYPHKGHDSLLQGFAAVVGQLPNARLVVVGDGSETINLFRQAARLGIQDRITWLGALWQRDIMDTVLGSAAAFVSMSRFEGVPISVLEARRHGLPLLLSDIPGHRDAAGSNTTFVPVDDTDAFARHAVTLLRGPSARTEQADLADLGGSWEEYRRGLLGIVERAWTLRQPVGPGRPR
ncbi:glycosyltransferase family 4 protein [Kitasatospora viridis]|uniref:D-inositol 3-phosphate glycosyltransferase n=1 Tax=Kitasatospora viridis TaxID=281105 RepID=A0A561SDW7_9ACTN|nr:glycosyltransferase family 4 protein [Kitasatospora viridis]TWF73035.1 glycosyltransferase involved in cell wall biosynthesis [Kitasatospora viridis]